MKTKFLLCSVLVLGLMAGCEEKSPLDNPKDEDVKTAIAEIEGVKNFCLATEDNDPNEQLNKDGGYTGAVFFRLEERLFLRMQMCVK